MIFTKSEFFVSGNTLTSYIELSFSFFLVGDDLVFWTLLIRFRKSSVCIICFFPVVNACLSQDSWVKVVTDTKSVLHCLSVVGSSANGITPAEFLSISRIAVSLSEEDAADYTPLDSPFVLVWLFWTLMMSFSFSSGEELKLTSVTSFVLFWIAAISCS